MKKIFYLFILFIVFSCTQETSSFKKNYFDLAGVIQQQIAEFSKTKPSVNKTVFLNAEKETIRTKDIDWAKELVLFLEADLNKQAYQNSYEVTKTDSTENYDLKTTENLPVKSLSLIFDKNKNLTKAKAILKAKNYLYESDKMLIIKLLDKKIISYEINTSQELFIGKRKNFKVVGIIEK